MDVGVGMMEDGGVNQKLRSVCVLLTSCVVGLSFFFFFSCSLVRFRDFSLPVRPLS